ncbi:sensor histidine kinase [Paenibacillus eucommiae]|uniref:histidine kinase n=1 Tax=Paenibacillus eucommiae TaxID=1355755 RepID=A0ABS4J3Y8_9BACL|nr:sensor histidine kinase [Paenibacillus eucommiae]MBP1993806.1 two-component system sensor histidine kinase YesM [Paenibacillus eucommiae]
MQLMERTRRRAQHWIKGLGIRTKMIIGYMIVVVIPVLGSGAMLYNQIYESGLNNFAQNNQSLVEQVQANLQNDMDKIESVYNLLQFNSYVTEFVSGYYDTPADQIYVFNKYINPLLSYIYSINPQIQDLKIYKFNSSVLQLGDTILDFDEQALESSEHSEHSEQSEQQSEQSEPFLDIDDKLLIPNEGNWVVKLDKLEKNADQLTQLTQLTYYKKLLNQEFSKALGVMKISVDMNMLYTLFQMNDTLKHSEVYFVQEKTGTYALVSGGTVQYQSLAQLPDSFSSNRQAKAAPYSYTITADQKVLVNTLELDKLQLKALIVTPVTSLFGISWKTKMNMILLIFVFLTVLSFIYYMITSSLVQRIIRLAGHMRKVKQDNLLPYQEQYKEELYKDEISLLISSYNFMIERIDRLVNTVHRAELRQKEMAFVALQAQINPHFLYNSLESIRMMAEANGDAEAANMTYTLGKVMRYSLSNHSTVSLKEELEHVENYLGIQKIRLGSRLTYHLDIRAALDHFVCPKFIIQPLVENSVIHGISKWKRKGEITIQITEDASMLRIVIQDNGCGMPSGQLADLQQHLLNPVFEPAADRTAGDRTAGDRAAGDSGKRMGIGLSNVHERLRAFYGDGSGIGLQSTEGEGTTYVLTLRKRGDFQ